MRHSTLVASAMVLLGVGMVTARLGAQVVQTHPDLAVEGIMKPRAEAALSSALKEQRLKDALRMVEAVKANPAIPAIDCKMIVAKGDPAIDPEIVKQPPSDRVKQSMRVILVPTCPK